MGFPVPLGDDVALHVRHRPGRRPPAFLLVHGLASNARLWDEAAERLAAAGHPVYAADLRGHGESPASQDGYDNDTATADLAALAGALGLRGAVVAGHSWGAHLALRLAAQHPHLVSGLALVEGGWYEPARIYGSWEAFVSVMALTHPDLHGATLGGMRDYLRSAHPDWSGRAIDASLASLRVTPEGSLAQVLPPEHRTSIMQSMWDDPPSPWYPAVTVPTLLIPAVPVTNPRWPQDIATLVKRIRVALETAAASLPRATVRAYPDADHDLHAQQPGPVAEDLLRLAHTVLAERPVG
ncbi:alpha/beta fold hydrolase [Streptomyces boncukensis]|uniref:Alpha/beta hydrolase n=1 Tax=Streptomyces boncukensis TaxID=2711219 RepID=A0A6G4X7Y1_9ACTN|nr:alpha/beta fold hydrolase [Streptomyces boncukensis]NGO72957.1 alpha/beta hydrolase [Streptomyces boncukensis]